MTEGISDRAPVVLVHGGLHGAWCWDRLVPLVLAETVAVDLPGRGGQPADRPPITLDTWADHVIETACSFGRPIVLVGHSLGGVTLTETARRNVVPIQRLVYISCLVAPEGEIPAHLIAGDEWPALFGPTGDFMPPNPEVCRELLCNDMNDGDTAEILARVTPEPPGPLLGRVTLRGFPDVSRTYVRLGQDAAVPPTRQAEMIANLGGADEVWIDSGHNVMWSHPQALADVLNGLT